MSLPHALTSSLSPEEQQRRRAIIEQGATQVRLEGLVLPSFYWEEAERYVRGEITLDEMRLCLLEHLKHVS